MQAVATVQKVSNYTRTAVNAPDTTVEARKIISGRTPLLTPDLHANILEHLRNGATMTEAARRSGVALSTLYEWRSVNSSFSESLAQAREEWTAAIVDRGLTGIADADESSMISVRKAESYGKLALDIAGRLNSDYSPKSQQKNLNVNVNVDKPVDLDMFRR